MSPEPEQNLFLLIGTLTGRVDSILTAMAVWQQGAQARDERVERLEQRQTELEARLITRDDLRPLMEKVDGLVASEASRRGGTSAMGAISAQGAVWIGSVAGLLGAVIALLALVNSGRNTREIIRQEQRLPAVEHRAR